MRRKISEWKVEYLGIDTPDYFPGYGVALTRYDGSVAGIGLRIIDATYDALEAVADADIDVPPELEAEALAFAKALPNHSLANCDNEEHFYVGISWRYAREEAEHTDDDSEVNLYI